MIIEINALYPEPRKVKRAVEALEAGEIIAYPTDTVYALGCDLLNKKTIDRWLWPDVFRNQDTSVSQAKRAISDYRKAVGDPVGLAELMVFYCEQASGFCKDIGQQDEGYFDALVRMFEQALKSANTLPATDRDDLIARLDHVREISHAFGYGVGDDMDFLLAKYTRRSG